MRKKKKGETKAEYREMQRQASKRNYIRKYMEHQETVKLHGWLKHQSPSRCKRFTKEEIEELNK